MRSAAQLVRAREEGSIGSVTDVRRYRGRSETSSLLLKCPIGFDAVSEDGTEIWANDCLPILPGTEALASTAGGWLVLAFLCDAGRAPRIQLIPAENIVVAASLVPDGVPVCAIPLAAVSRWGWSGPMCEGGDILIGPGVYFLTPRLEDLCRMFVQLSGLDVSNRAYRTVRLYELACETMDAFVRDELMPADGDVRLAAAERAQLNCARQHIVKHYAEKLTIGQIARAAGVGRAKLIRGFRELYGCTVHEMITKTRLEVASASLRSTRQPISRIAFECGYHSSAAFARAFAKFCGSSPSAFRSEE